MQRVRDIHWSDPIVGRAGRTGQVGRTSDQCASEGYALKGCMWIADLKMDWEGSLYNAGGRYAITHCCCDYPVLSKEATKQARDQ